MEKDPIARRNRFTRGNWTIHIIVVIAIFLMAPAYSHAYPIVHEGSRQFQFGFDYRDSDWRLDFMYGQFVTDELLIGGLFSASDYAESIWSTGILMEHHFHLGTMTYPYVSAIALYEDYDSDNHIRFGPAAGINHFITDYFAIDLKMRYLFSSDPGQNEDLELMGGLRILF